MRPQSHAHLGDEVMFPDRELLELLGLPGPALRLAGEAALPLPASAEGASDILTLVALAAADSLLCTPVRFEVGNHFVQSVDARPDVLVVPADAVEAVLSGVLEPRQDELLFDAGADRLVARLRDGDRTYVLDACKGRVRLWEHDSPEAETDQDLPGTEHPEVAIPAPDVARWMAELDGESWLIDEAVALARSDDPLRQAAAAGLVARLVHGQGTAAVDRVRIWAAGLPDSGIARLEALALGETARLSDLLDALEEVGARDPEGAGPAAEAVARRRDDLESVRLVLRLANRETRVSRALGALDLRAIERTTMLQDLLPPLADSDDRWHAVGWHEPEAWWAGVG